MTDVVLENYYFVLVLERFGMQLGFHDKTVDDVCKEFDVSSSVFLTIANLNTKKLLKKTWSSIVLKLKQFWII